MTHRTRPMKMPHLAIAGLCLLVIALAATLLGLGGLIVPRQDIACPTTIQGLTVTVEGSVQCSMRGFWHETLVMHSSTEASGEADRIRLSLPKDSPPAVISFVTQALGRPDFFTVSASNTERALATVNDTGTPWSENSRVLYQVSLPRGDREAVFNHPANQVATEISQITLEWPDAAIENATARMSSPNDFDSRYYLFATFTLAVVFFAFVFFHDAKPSHWQMIFCLVAAFSLVAIVCGMPFGSNAGWYDRGDDTSYVHWAFNLGYLWEPHLTQGGLSSAAADGNIHPWGTGLLLAPGLALLRLFRPGLGLDNLHLTIMAAESTLYTLFAIIILYLTFATFVPRRIAAFTAFLSLVSTSLIKWTFMRNIFSHAPEAFVVALFAWSFVRTYVSRSGFVSGRLAFAIMLGTAILMPQIRRENILLLAIPLYFECLLRRQRPQWFRNGLLLMASGITAVICLQLTNYWTREAHFWHQPTASLFNATTIIGSLKRNFQGVVFAQDTGLFAWWSVASWLAIASLCIRATKVRIALPFAVAVVSYLIMCMLHEYPTGAEWQNRFLLKISPIIFFAAGWSLHHTRRRIMKVALAAALVLQAGHQLQLYYGQRPAGMAFHVDFLSDSFLWLPQIFPTQNPLFFNLPAFLAVVTVIFGAILAYSIYTRPESPQGSPTA